MQAHEASQEALQMLAAYLPRRYPQRFQMEGTTMHNHARGQSLDTAVPDEDALEVACRFVQVTSP